MRKNKQNVAWYGKLPPNWREQRIKTIFMLKDVRSYLPLEEVNLISVYSKIGVVQHSGIEHTTGNKARNANGYKVVNTDDIIVNILLCWMGAIGRSEYNGVTSPAYDVYSPRENINSKYYHYLFRLPIFSGECYKVGKGIMSMRWRTYSPQFTNIVVPVPPRPEQDWIVRFLDWKVSSINRLISIKKKQLVTIQELINKQFQHISSDSTQQLRLKHLVSLCNDFIEISPSQYYMKTGMYNRGRGIFRREAVLGEDMGDSLFQKIQSGCVMISGQFAWEAAAYVTTEEDEAGVASHRYYLLTSKRQVPSEYIWCFLMSDYGKMQMRLCSHGSAGRNRPLNIKELLNVYIPIPQLDSQLDALVQNVQVLMKLRKNLLLQEHILTDLRNRLISDVVTGKIDASGVEIPEYEVEAIEGEDADGEDDRDMGDVSEDEEK